MVKVRMKTIYAGPEGSCQPGQTIMVDEAEADDLVSGNYAEYVTEASEAEDDETAGDDAQAFPEDIKVLKGGYFELPNGDKVRGKNKALAAYEALKTTE